MSWEEWPPDQLHVITQLASGAHTEAGRREVSAWSYRLGIQVGHFPAAVKPQCRVTRFHELFGTESGPFIHLSQDTADPPDVIIVPSPKTFILHKSQMFVLELT